MGPKIIEHFLMNKHLVTVFNRGSHIAKLPLDKINFIKGNREIGFGIKERFDAVVDICAYNGIHTGRALKELSFDYFLHISTVAVYKKPTILPLQEDTSPIGPWPEWGSYGAGKLESENVLAQSGARYGVLRPVYVLGPHNNCDRERFIYNNIKRRQKLFLPANGETVAQFTFVENIAEATVLLVQKQKAGIFNCCGDEIITMRGLVTKMAEIVEEKPLLEFNCGINSCSEKNTFPFADISFVCDNTKIKSLGLKFTPLLDGLKRDFINHYKYAL